MELRQSYETTISDAEGRVHFTALVLPSRSLGPDRLSLADSTPLEVAKSLFGATFDSEFHLSPSVTADIVYQVLAGSVLDIGQQMDEELYAFANYVANAPVIPFESSPLSPESLSGIAVKAVKAGTVTVGASVGWVAGGSTPFLLITVPLGIVLCGAAVSFTKWLEENRRVIWNKVFNLESPKERPIRHVRSQP